jgi:hypothetical protein
MESAVMSDTVQDSSKPVEQSYKPFINSSNCKELGRKSGEARRAKRELVKLLLADPTRNILPSKPEPAQAVAQALYLSDNEREKAVRTYKAQISRLQALLDGAARGTVRELTIDSEGLERVVIIEPKGIKALVDALRGVELILWRYAGIPGEGTLKPSSPAKQDRRSAGRGPT